MHRFRYIFLLFAWLSDGNPENDIGVVRQQNGLSFMPGMPLFLALHTEYHVAYIYIYIYIYFDVQSQKAVSAYFTSPQMLPFGFTKQYCTEHLTCLPVLI